MRRNSNIPDGYWYGEQPRLLVDHRGSQAEANPQQLTQVSGWGERQICREQI